MKPLKIMILEDSQELLEGWQEILSLSGHDVVGHTRARDVLGDVQHLREADVFVSDYYLPDLNGLETIQRAREVRPGLPAILLTGARQTTLRDEVRALPDVMLLNKPVGADELEAALDALLGASVRVAPPSGG